MYSELTFLACVVVAVMTAIAIKIVQEIIVSATSLSPNEERFVKDFMTVATVLPVTWILFMEFSCKLFLGYHLTRSLLEVRDSWDISKSLCVRYLLHPTSGGTVRLHVEPPRKLSGADEAKQRKLIRFSKLRNADEMEKEIDTLKTQIADLNNDLICLENMRFGQDFQNDSIFSSMRSLASSANESKSFNSGRSIEPSISRDNTGILQELSIQELSSSKIVPELSTSEMRV